jgi:DHA1 family multidrug resistance protein-like MFS transporter
VAAVHDPTANWKRTLAVVWVAQFFSIAAFSFGLPFVAYYIQEMGITGRSGLLFWTSIFHGSAPLAFCIAAPIWGMLADRWGRRPMLIRANVAAMLVLIGMGLATDVGWLIAFRVGQGLFTGTVPAAQTLVATSTPEQRQGVALGTLSAAIFAGMTAGVAAGGWCAELFGYSTSFIIGGCLSGVSVLIIMIGTSETFVRPQHVPPLVPVTGWRRLLPAIGPGLPLLAVVGGMSLTRQFETPILPLLIQELRDGRLEGSAGVMGNRAEIGSIEAMIAGTLIGQLSDRFAPTRIASVCAVLTAGTCIPFALAHQIGLEPLYAVRFAAFFFAAGLDPAFQVWLSRITSPERRGAVFGWATTARSLGWMIGPLLGSGIADQLGLAPTYWFQALLFLALIPLCFWAARRIARGAEQNPTAAVPQTVGHSAD